MFFNISHFPAKIPATTIRSS